MAASLINIIRIKPDPDNSTRTLTHVMAESHGVIITRYTDNGTAKIKKWDVSSLLVGIEELGETGYRRRSLDLDGEPVSMAIREQGDDNGSLDYDSFEFYINGFGLTDETYQEDADDVEYPAYYLWPSDEAQSPLTTTEEDYAWEDALSYAQKQQFAIDMIEEVWRPQKREWLRELGEYIDVNPNITQHGGYWLRAADRALQIEFQDPKVDPLIVARLAQEAALGASDINSVESFVNGLNGITSSFPNGPSNPVLWVSKNDDGSVEQVNLQESVQYTESDQSLDNDYNPIDHSWVIDNQIGSFTVDDYTPEPDDVVTASGLHDPDDIKAGTIQWQWQHFDEGTWQDIGEVITGKSASITIPTDASDGAMYRVTVTYEDNFEPNQELTSEIIIVSV